MKARFLKSKTVNELYNQIPDHLHLYREGNFDFIEKDHALFFEGNASIYVDKLNLIKSTEKDLREAENCELIYEAFEGMTPYIARDERIWVYLTHAILLDYTRQRWPQCLSDDDETAVKNIRLHFFSKGLRGIERDNAGSRLWWMAHLCSRVNKMPLNDALKCFLHQSDVRANLVERPTTSQSIKVFSAIIKKLNESFHSDQSLYKRETFRSFMKEINLLGGVKLLDVMSNHDLKLALDTCI